VLAATDVQSAVKSALQAVGSSVAEEETAAGAAALVMPKPTFRPRATATAGKRGADGKGVKAARAQGGALCAGAEEAEEAEEAEQEEQKDAATEGGAAADGGGGGQSKKRGRFRKKVSFAASL
jgi:hypothetical protein